MVEQVLASPLVSSLVCGPERLLIYNDAAARLYGQGHPAALGRPLPETFPDGWAAVAPFYARAFAGETVQVAGQPVETRGAGEGTDVFDALLTPVRETDGHVAYVHMTGTELGARDRAAALLRASEAQYRNLFDALDEGFCTIEVLFDAAGDPVDYRFLSVNAAFERQTGLKDVVGRTMKALAPSHEASWFEIYGRIVRSGRGERFEHRADALGHWYEVNAFPVGATEQRRVAVLFKDIRKRKLADEQMRESAERQAFLLRLSDALRAEPDADAVANRALAMLSAHLVLDRCYITYYRPAEDRADFPYQIGNDTVPPLPAHVRLSDFPDAYQQVLERTFVVDDDFERRGLSEDERANSASLGMRAMLASTIRRGDKTPLASMMAVSSRPRHWTFSEIALVEDVAERTWGAIERARDETARHQAEELNALLIRFSDAVHDVTDPQRVADAACQLVGERLGTERAYWAEMDWATREYVIVSAVHQSGVPIIAGRFAIDAWEPLASLHRAGHPVVVEDTQTDVRLPLAMREGYARIAVGADLAAPVTVNGVLRCALVVNQRRTRRWTPEEVALVQSVADRCWREVVRARAEEALRANEERLRMLIAGIPQLVWRAVNDGAWTWASRQWTAYTGQSEPESLGWGWLGALHPDDRDAARAAWVRAVETGLFEADYRLYHARKQRYRWFQTRATPVRDEGGAIVEWLGTSTDVDDLRTLQVRLEVLVNELQHRARNLLGVVTAIADRTVKQGGSVEAFEERLQALSRAQGLLSQSGSDRVAVGALVRTELAAYADGATDRVGVAGPEVFLTARQVQNFALALHELTTNAVKYGALRHEAGRLAVSWQVMLDQRGRRRLALTWVESGVPLAPDTVLRRGYGTELIQEALAYALQATVAYERGSDGVRCRIEMPIS